MSDDAPHGNETPSMALMSRLEFAIRILREHMGLNDGEANAFTLMIATMLFNSLTAGLLIRLGGRSTVEDRACLATLARRFEGKATEQERIEGKGPWAGVSSHLQRVFKEMDEHYSKVTRPALMQKRLAEGLRDPKSKYVRADANGRSYSYRAMKAEYLLVMALMRRAFPEAAAHYQHELKEVEDLTTFLKWNHDGTGRTLVDPMSDHDAAWLLKMPTKGHPPRDALKAYVAEAILLGKRRHNAFVEHGQATLLNVAGPSDIEF